MIEEKTISNELDWGWDLREPCAECPFLKSTPPERKGLAGDMLEFICEVFNSGQTAHSCHRTDPRSDYPGAQTFNGKIQMCAGFTMICLKAKWPTMPMVRATIAGKLDRRKLRGWDGVHTWKNLLAALTAWAKDGIK